MSSFSLKDRQLYSQFSKVKMQRRFLLLCSAAVLLRCCHHSAAQTPPCYVTEDVVPDVICPNSVGISEIGDFLGRLSASAGATEYNKFGLYDNRAVRRLPAGLLADLRFSVIEVMSCPNLTQVDDFLGASSATVKNLSMVYDALTEVPQLTAPALLNLRLLQTDAPVVVRRSAFQGMTNIEEIKLESASVTPLAFYDLKRLKNLYMYSLAADPLLAGSFHFDSPSLACVFLVGDEFGGLAEPGTFGGFPRASQLWIQKILRFSADLFFNLLSRGVTVESPEPVTCDCHVAWIRRSAFLLQTRVRCLTGMQPVELPSVDEADFENCGLV
ncbi:uncharacterized protein LOC122256385 [Penaeus japonicus]|uniref:uncharacterized protein LOC122256385 n=1 Tax=Penaeus japonicus TaxID=27405 RepID=UPI001C7112F5|nr:uncharacterized protein LOC122256385 [Penaeus japonicus]